ncbi:MAG: hypothetical protein Q7J67_05450 [bacterium]|nr:hypothetical protein [bacterium]
MIIRSVAYLLVFWSRQIIAQMFFKWGSDPSKRPRTAFTGMSQEWRYDLKVQR